MTTLSVFQGFVWLDCYFSKYQGGFSNENVVSCVTIQFYLHPKYYFGLSMNYRMSSIQMQHMLPFFACVCSECWLFHKSS